MKGIDIIDLIAIVNRIEEKNLNAPFGGFQLVYIDASGKHIIRYSDIFDESKSAVIHQLNKILKYPQNYIDVNVFVTTVEPPEHDRTYMLRTTVKNKMELEDDFFNQQCEALRTGIDTKKNFTEDMLEYDDLLMFITYEMCHGDTDLVYEKLAEYFSDDYDRYCENIIDNWVNGE